MIQGALKFLDILKTELDDTVPSLFVFAHIVTSGAYFFSAPSRPSAVVLLLGGLPGTVVLEACR